METLAAEGHRVSPLPTTGPGTAASIVRQAVAGGADLIIVAGGDGTINEAMNGMVHSGVPLAVLPGGTANVLATELGLGSRVEQAARQIGLCSPTPVALGRLTVTGDRESRYFLMMAGVGFDASIVHNLDLRLKAKLGKLAYWWASWSSFARRLAEFEVEIDGRRYRASFVLASRVANYGGDLEICRGASLLHDDFEVVVFEGRYVVRYLFYFLGVLAGKVERVNGAHLLHTSRLKLAGPERSPVYIQVDGEEAGRLPATLEIEPGALTLLIPESYREKAGKVRIRSHVPIG